MGKPFEEITEAGFELLEQILEQPNTLPGDFYFNEPTDDGQLELLLRSQLAVLDAKDQLSITELGRAALKHHDYTKEQDIHAQKQRAEELEVFKSIADGAQEQAKSAQKLAETAADSSRTSTKYARISTVLSIIAIIISIIAIVMQQFGT